jgi:hypothetical protein
MSQKTTRTSFPLSNAFPNKFDISRDIGASIKLFVDDTSLYVTVESLNIAANILNNDL